MDFIAPAIARPTRIVLGRTARWAVRALAGGLFSLGLGPAVGISFSLVDVPGTPRGSPIFVDYRMRIEIA